MQERLEESLERREGINYSHGKDGLDLHKVLEIETFDNMLGLAGLLQIGGLDIRSFINRKVRV